MPDLTSMSAAVGALLKERQQTVAVTESSCGGLISGHKGRDVTRNQYRISNTASFRPRYSSTLPRLHQEHDSDAPGSS